MTDSEADTAAKADAATVHPTGLAARVRHQAVAVTPYAGALLARGRRATKAATRPALRAWFRPSLRRRIGTALAIMSLVGFVVVGGSIETIDNLFFHPGYGSWGGIGKL